MIYITIGAYPLWTGNIWHYPLDFTWDELKGKTWVEILNPQLLNIRVENNSFEIKDLVKDQSTCDFTLNDFDNAYSFSKNMPVTIFDSNFDKIFGGFVDIIEESIIGQRDKYFKQFKISCVDNHYLVNKRKIVKAFKDENISICVRWIIDNILVNEGISIGNIESTTKTITKVCNFLSISDVLDEFADTCGFTWFIDINKKLYFIPITKYHSPFDIEIVDGYSQYILDGTLKIIDQNSEYRNTQYIRGSQAKTVLQTQTFKGDGTLQTFTVQYPIAEKPVIKVNGVEKTVGISGVDDSTLYDWYWTKKSNQFSQSSNGTRLTSSDTLQIQYYGLYDMSVKAINFEEIDNLAPIDGSSGIVEAVNDDSTLTTQTDAIKKANALLATFAVLGKTISFTTLSSGLEAGQLLHITSNIHNLNHDTLITDVRKFEEDTLLKYEITSIIGPTNDYWIKVFNKLAAARTQSNDSNTTDVIQIFWEFTKNWTSEQIPNIWNSCNPGIAVNDAKFPCFDNNDKIKYVQFNTATGYRRYKIQQRILGTSIITTMFIPSTDLNDETFTEITLWGGSLATEELDSGLLLDTHNYQYRKNSLESLMIIFTDNKWS